MSIFGLNLSPPAIVLADNEYKSKPSHLRPKTVEQLPQNRRCVSLPESPSAVKLDGVPFTNLNLSNGTHTPNHLSEFVCNWQVLQ